MDALLVFILTLFLIFGVIALVVAIQPYLVIAIKALACLALAWVLYKISRAIFPYVKKVAEFIHYKYQLRCAAKSTGREAVDEVIRQRMMVSRRPPKEWEEVQRRDKAAAEAKELERQRHRDADKQNVPYTYEVDQHANESLAIRYGIANTEKKVREYWYYAAGGVKKRNKDRDTFYYEAADSIRLKKVSKLRDDLYQVLLVDYGNRPARAVIEPGKEYVKTFYPLYDSWFDKYVDLEKVLKNNGTFTLKELATFHVQKAVDVNHE